jgi:hypothetical protein
VAGERRRHGRARALSDEGDDPGLTDRVGPPVSESEATAESDKQQEGGYGRIGQVEQAGRIGQGGRRWAAAGLENKGGSRAEIKKKNFQIKIWIFEFTKALEICRRRFRRNFDMRIFLNYSMLLKDFRKI